MPDTDIVYGQNNCECCGGPFGTSDDVAGEDEYGCLYCRECCEQMMDDGYATWAWLREDD